MTVTMVTTYTAVKTARKLQHKKKRTQRFRLFDEISLVIQDDSMRESKEKPVETRAHWNNDHSNFVSPS